jgi:hypothetical protein
MRQLFNVALYTLKFTMYIGSLDWHWLTPTWIWAPYWAGWDQDSSECRQTCPYSHQHWTPPEIHTCMCVTPSVVIKESSSYSHQRRWRQPGGNYTNQTAKNECEYHNLVECVGEFNALCYWFEREREINSQPHGPILPKSQQSKCLFQTARNGNKFTFNIIRLPNVLRTAVSGLYLFPINACMKHLHNKSQHMTLLFVIHRLAMVSMNPQTAIASCRTTTHSWPLPTMNNIKAPYKMLYIGWQISCMAQRGLRSKHGELLQFKQLYVLQYRTLHRLWRFHITVSITHVQLSCSKI